MKIRELIIAITLLHGVSLGAQERDIFEQFALQKRIETPGLEKNEARPLPNIKLPWDETCQKGFQPSVKMTTQSQLEQALAAMRKRYAPFMRDLAPKLPQTRKQYVLNEFQWRLLASEMRTDSAGNLYPIPQVEPTTDTTYQTVTIPHYTGPINKAEGVYRKQLRITAEQLESDHLYLHFNGVDYTTAIYLNGKEVGHHTGLFGAFEFDIKPYVHPGENQLEIHIFNDSPMMGDNFFLGPNRKFGKKLAACGGPGWDEPGLGRGWTMCPVGFGIWQRCYLETRPDAYIGFPVPLLTLARLYGADFPIRKALVSGDACPKGVMETLQTILGGPLYPHYGSRECGLGGAVTCPAHEGMHIRENHILPEIIDEHGNVLPEGRYGELVITTIGLEAMPLIRYRTGDFTRLLPPCPCGGVSRRIDMVSRRSGPVSMEDLDSALFPLDFLADYRAQRRGEALHLQCAVLEPGKGAILEAAASACCPGLTVRVETFPADRAQRPMYLGKRYCPG